MSDVWQLLVTQAQQQGIAEIVAVILAVAYVWLAAEENIFCWPAALVSTLIYTYIFWDVNLAFQMLLNAYYAVMAVLGWLAWQQAGPLAVTRVKPVPPRLHFMMLVIGILLTLIVVTFAEQWLAYENLFLDTAIAVFSLLTTWLTVRKYLHSWVYWMFINAASVYLFIQYELYFTSLLMLIYLILAIRGYYQWKSSMYSLSTADARL